MLLDADLLPAWIKLIDDTQPMMTALNYSFQTASGPTEKRLVMDKMVTLIRNHSDLVLQGSLMNFLNNSGDYVGYLIDRIDASQYKAILKQLLWIFERDIQKRLDVLSIWSKFLKFVPTMEPQKIKHTQTLFDRINFSDLDESCRHKLELQIEIISRIQLPKPCRLNVGDEVEVDGKIAKVVAMKTATKKGAAGRRIMSSDWTVVKSVANKITIVLGDGRVVKGNQLNDLRH
jgi:hypothetical protein